jgi:microcystin-dependent protein
MEGTIGEIRIFGGLFAPQYWAFCNGAALSISENEALYSIIGDTYGGNQSNFNLPNLVGAVPVGAGQAPGLSNYIVGQTGGAAQITLTPNNIGQHTHPISGTVQGILVSSEDGHKISPVGNYPAVNGDNIYTTVTDSSVMAQPKITLQATPVPVTSNLPIDILKPYVAIYYIICIEGLYPSRN